MDDNFYSFYKKSLSLPSSFKRSHGITKNTRTHHQSIDRITKIGHRKSGKLNLVAASENQSLKNPVVNTFANSNKTFIKGLKWPVVKPILDTYKIQHDHESDEGYDKALNRTKCKLTGAKIMIRYIPQNKTWVLFKK
jgi:hypothetical protein